ncbi:hypothetical protein TrispH2_008831 [Trichoplax sp. H2]|nr:hypothetical protein TrispH2_008831 [Trichoplax sp. H2]|eukprot:RDD39110.1 hypothetical protein TrispH2_008831 [Trichoplax sp. H2]
MDLAMKIPVFLSMLYIVTITAKISSANGYRTVFVNLDGKTLNKIKFVKNDVPIQVDAETRHNITSKWLKLRFKQIGTSGNKMSKLSMKSLNQDSFTKIQSSSNHRIHRRAINTEANVRDHCQLREIKYQAYRWINTSHIFLLNDDTSRAFKVAQITEISGNNKSNVHIRICTEVIDNRWNETLRVLNYITPTLELFCYTPVIILHIVISRLNERFDYFFLSTLLGTIGYKILRLAGSILQHIRPSLLPECQVLATFRHYFLTVSYASMIVVVFDIYFYFSCHTPPSSEGLLKIYYICFAWLIPAMLSITLFSIKYVDNSYDILDGTPRCDITETWARMAFVIIPCVITFLITILFPFFAKKVIRSRRLKYRRASEDKKLIARKYNCIIKYTIFVMIILAANLVNDTTEVSIATHQRIVQLHVFARVADILCAIFSVIVMAIMFFKWLKVMNSFANRRQDLNQLMNHNQQ